MKYSENVLKCFTGFWLPDKHCFRAADKRYGSNKCASSRMPFLSLSFRGWRGIHLSLKLVLSLEKRRKLCLWWCHLSCTIDQLLVAKGIDIINIPFISWLHSGMFQLLYLTQLPLYFGFSFIKGFKKDLC